MYGLAESHVTGSGFAQSYALAPYVPVVEQRASVPFSLKYGPLYDAELPLLTTKDCFPGIAKYLLKSYVILKVLRSGLGLSTVVRSIPLYTAILLIGLIGSTFPDALTPRAITPFAVSGEFGLSRAKLSPESSGIQESITTFVSSPVVVPIPTLVPLSKICEL